MEELDTQMPLIVIPAQDEMTQAFLIYWKKFWSNWAYGTGKIDSALYIAMYLEEKEEFIKNWKLAYDEKQR